MKKSRFCRGFFIAEGEDGKSLGSTSQRVSGMDERSKFSVYRESVKLLADMLEKPIRHAVSVVVVNDKGETLFALRSPSKSEFPLVWSLPSHFVKVDENFEDTVRRIGRNKLGAELEPLKLLNEGYGERPEFRLFMHVFLGKVTTGNPCISSDDFAELKWSEPNKQLSSMERMGDCCRLYQEYLTRAADPHASTF